MKARKTPTAEQLRVWREYIETASSIGNELANRMQRTSALSASDYPVLLALSEAPNQTLRSSAIADELGWERSRVSHHLGRMEKRGMIRREICSQDSRGSNVILTPEGAAAFRRGSVPHLRDVYELFIEALSHEQLTALADITASLRAHQEQIDRS